MLRFKQKKPPSDEGGGCPVDTSAKQKHRPRRQPRRCQPNGWLKERKSKAFMYLNPFSPSVFACGKATADSVVPSVVSRHLPAQRGVTSTEGGKILISPHRWEQPSSEGGRAIVSHQTPGNNRVCFGLKFIWFYANMVQYRINSKIFQKSYNSTWQIAILCYNRIKGSGHLLKKEEHSLYPSCVSLFY